MRTLIFILALSPFFGFSQSNDVVIKLMNANNQQIKGGSTFEKYRDWIYTSSINSGGNNNTQLTFTMGVNPASADLKKAMATGEFLSNGLVSVNKQGSSGGKPIVVYTIKMEKIKVLSCIETMVNRITTTTVVLKAARIGWTYYTMTNTGVTTVSRKYGWDAEANKEWTNFSDKQ